MIKTISAMQARQNLGAVMNAVSLRGDEYIIERAGKPIVAIISIAKFNEMNPKKIQEDEPDIYSILTKEKKGK